MTETETIQATNALKAWFISQDISPADAGIMMIKLMAENYTHKSKDIFRLQDAVNSHSVLLSIEIAGYLRK